ncbi:hypothetical protein BHM03_00033899 [Ensete ventricosum]|nr:hypothetical protein BHM03_00033899 [Ensete ventricosum]
MAQGSSPEEDQDSSEDCQEKPKGLPGVGKVLKWMLAIMIWDLVGSSLGDSSKELGNLSGMPREITRKKIGGLTTRLSKVVRVCES